jgi:uncharacterized protein GlcG (DUF336 family)
MRAAVHRNPTEGSDLVTFARGDAAWRGGGVPLGAGGTAIGAAAGGDIAVDQDQQVAEARATSNVRVLRQEIV